MASSSTAMPSELGAVMPLLAQFLELAARYRAYWPAPSTCRPSAFPEAPVSTLQRCLADVRAWAQDAEPVVRTLQRGKSERSELQLWQRVLDALASKKELEMYRKYTSEISWPQRKSILKLSPT